MRHPIIVVFLALFLMACQAVGAERGALFRVSGHGHTLHLYGTIHAGRAGFYPLEPRIGQAMAAAPALALEIDPSAYTPAMTATLSRYAVFAPGSPGIAALAPERRSRIEAGLTQHGIAREDIAGLKPWMLVTLLAQREAAALGYVAEYGVDAHLARLAHEGREGRGRPLRVVELETWEYQLALFDRLTDEQQWRLLEETLAEMASGRQRQETRALFDAYERADQEALEAIARRIDSDDSIGGAYLRQVVLHERNGPMADKIASLLAREDKAVVAVGLLHLIGKHSLPELLRKRGIKVERIY